MKIKLGKKYYNGARILKALCLPYVIFMVATMNLQPSNWFTYSLAWITPIAGWFAIEFVSDMSHIWFEVQNNEVEKVK